MTMDLAELLRTHFLFHGVNSDCLDSVHEMATVSTWRAGDLVADVAAIDPKIYLVLKGEVALVNNAGAMVGCYLPGEMSGEMALIDWEPRQGQLVCQADSQIATIDTRELNGLMVDDPVLRARVMQNLALLLLHRLRQADIQPEFAAQSVLRVGS